MALLTRKWREDAGAWAVITPWLFLRVAARMGWTPGAVTDLMLRSKRRMGL